MIISCDKIFLLVTRILSLWPGPSLELAIIASICVSQAHLVLFVTWNTFSCVTIKFWGENVIPDDILGDHYYMHWKKKLFKGKVFFAAIFFLFYLLFSSPQIKAQVSSSDPMFYISLSVHLLTLNIFIFSRTSGPISTKLGTKHPWVKGIQVF